MARQGINTGSSPDAGDGDALLTGAIKINSNFDEIYTALGDGTNITNSIGFAVTAGIATYATTAGIATYATTAGIATYATTAGIATYATTAGIATYATTAGIASALISTASVNTTGSITASSFVGDGSGLTGVVGSGSGVVIKDDGSTVGTAGTIDFGNNLSVSAISAGIVTITASGGGGESYWISTAAGIHTLSNVGIGTTNPTSALTVQGTLSVSGVSTFNSTLNGLYLNNATNVKGTSNIAIGENALLNHTFGNNSIAIGYDSLRNASNPNFHNIGIGPYAGYNLTNGVLNTFLGYNSGYDMDGGSGNVIIGSFNGNSYGLDISDADDYIILSANGQSSTQPRLIVDPNGNIGIGTTNPTSALTVQGDVNVSGVSTFGAQVNINTGGSSKLNIGAPNDLYLQWDEGSQSAYLDTSATGNLYVQNNANGGIFLNAGTSNQAGVHLYPSDRVELRHAASKKFETLGAGVTVTGTTFTNQLSVSGVSTFANPAYFTSGGAWFNDGTSANFGNSNDLRIRHDGTTNYIENQTVADLEINIGTNTNSILFIKAGTITLARFYRDPLTSGKVELYHVGSKKFETAGAGVTVTGTTFTDQLVVSGVSTFTSNTRVGVDTSVGVILTSPNNTQYQLFVEDDGTLKTVAV